MTELERIRALERVETLSLRPEYIEIYLYVLFEDKIYLPKDCISDTGKPKVAMINKRVRELILLFGLELINIKSEED